MIKYFTIEDLLKHYLQKKFHILLIGSGNCPGNKYYKKIAPHSMSGAIFYGIWT